MYRIYKSAAKEYLCTGYTRVLLKNIYVEDIQECCQRILMYRIYKSAAKEYLCIGYARILLKNIYVQDIQKCC